MLRVRNETVGLARTYVGPVISNTRTISSQLLHRLRIPKEIAQHFQKALPLLPLRRMTRRRKLDPLDLLDQFEKRPHDDVGHVVVLPVDEECRNFEEMELGSDIPVVL